MEVLIRANQWTGFNMISASIMKEVTKCCGMKQYRAVKTKVIYYGKYHMFCYMTNNYLVLIVNTIYNLFVFLLT